LFRKDNDQDANEIIDRQCSSTKKEKAKQETSWTQEWYRWICSCCRGDNGNLAPDSSNGPPASQSHSPSFVDDKLSKGGPPTNDTAELPGNAESMLATSPSLNAATVDSFDLNGNMTRSSSKSIPVAKSLDDAIENVVSSDSSDKGNTDKDKTSHVEADSTARPSADPVPESQNADEDSKFDFNGNVHRSSSKRIPGDVLSVNNTSSPAPMVRFDSFDPDNQVRMEKEEAAHVEGNSTVNPSEVEVKVDGYHDSTNVTFGQETIAHITAETVRDKLANSHPEKHTNLPNPMPKQLSNIREGNVEEKKSFYLGATSQTNKQFPEQKPAVGGKATKGNKAKQPDMDDVEMLGI
jgi:hypothetical protein